MSDTVSATHDKARKLNTDVAKYGSFAEIGAGQEVVRWFFHVGGAAKTVARSISAYDMAISDSLYGAAKRYVSRQRLQAMLDQEFDLVVKNLGATRGSTTTFFAFADTVATRRPGHDEKGRGWIGIRFQTEPQGEPSQITLHAHLLDSTAVLQQEALGMLGVNLIYAAFFLRDDLPALVASLTDDIPTDRMDVDVVKVSGPAFGSADNRLLALQLVEQQLTDAAMFTSDGEVVQPSEVLYGKPVLVTRGSFRPATLLTIDLIQRGKDRFMECPQVQGQDPVILAEMTLNNLQVGAGVDHDDFLARAQILHVLGFDVLISRFRPFYQLADYLSCYTDRMVGLTVGVPTLRDILDEQYYEELGGGALESIGRLFKRSVKMYVYPTRDASTGEIISLDNAPMPPPWHRVRDLLLDLGRVEALQNYEPAFLTIHTPDVLAKLQRGDPSWEAQVPPSVAQCIKEQRLLGYKG
jgi:hypothetical protein